MGGKEGRERPKNRGILYAPKLREKFAAEAVKLTLPGLFHHPDASSIDLDGIWELEIYDRAGRIRFDGRVDVPYPVETPLSLVNILPEPSDTLVYYRDVYLPAYGADLHPIVRFMAVDMFCQVYADGILVGSHEGGYTPFEFDLAPAVGTARHFELKVVVRDMQDRSSISTGKQALKPSGIFYTTSTGLVGPVTIELLPAERILGVDVRSHVRERALDVRVRTTGTQKTANLWLSGESFTLPANTWQRIEPRMPLTLWSLESPTLIEAEATLGSDRYAFRFGFREFSVSDSPQGKVFTLNGQPILIRGVLDQGYYFGGGYLPASYAQLRSELALVKAMGFNCVRVHQKVPLTAYYDICDELGLLVIQDLPCGGSTPYSPVVMMGLWRNRPRRDDRRYRRFGRESAPGRRHFVRQAEEILELVASHPSVVSLCIFNEGWGQFDSSRIYKHLKELDPTRVYDTCSGWFDNPDSDVFSRHTYFFYRYPHVPAQRPYLLSEFGGLDLFVKGHFFGRRRLIRHPLASRSQAALCKAFERLFTRHLASQIRRGLAGYIYTQLADVEGECNGILTFDREVAKIDADLVRAMNNEMQQVFNSRF